MTDLASRYDIDTDGTMYAGGEHFNIAAVGAAQTPWWNRTLCAVNDAWVRLGVMKGDFYWHKYDDTDEFFMVMEGHLDIELEDPMVSLKPG